MNTIQLKPHDGTPCFCLLDESGKSIPEANRFLKAIELRGLSRHTIRGYGYDLTIIYRWLHKSNTSFEELKQADLFEFIEDQRKNGVHPKSINRRLTTCRLFYHFCFDQPIPRSVRTSDPASFYQGRGWDREFGMIQLGRPGRVLLKLKVPRKIIEPLTPKEVNQFLRDVDRYRDLAIFLLMLLCGLRSCEIINLTLESLCFVEKTIKILGKGQKERFLPLPELLADLLVRYLRLERPAHVEHRILFLVLQGTNRGKSLTPAGLRSLFRSRRSLTQVLHANPHRLRHTFGVEMARANVRLPVLQKMMGHAKPEQTLQYINLSWTDLNKEFQRAMQEINKRYELKENQL